MIYMILFVLHDPDKLTDLLDSWDQAGVSGITILPSTGMGKLKGEDILREDMPLIPSLEDILQTPEKSNRTLFTLVEGEEMIDQVIQATEAVIGNLDEPNTGILAVIPVSKTYGLRPKNGQNSHG